MGAKIFLLQSWLRIQEAPLGGPRRGQANLRVAIRAATVNTGDQGSCGCKGRGGARLSNLFETNYSFARPWRALLGHAWRSLIKWGKGKSLGQKASLKPPFPVPVQIPRVNMMEMPVYILSKAQILSIFCLSGEEREMPAFSGEEKAPERKLGKPLTAGFQQHMPLSPPPSSLFQHPAQFCF